MVTSKALDGVRVVDFGGFIAGPYCARMLGDLGADVIKVESIGGDPSRRAGPFPGDSVDKEHSGLYHYLNWNKRGVAIDVSKVSGRDILLSLLERADVFIVGLSVEEAEANRLEFETLHACFPRLIVSSVSTFGHTGPFARGAKGSDLQVAAGSGSAHRLGDPAREPLILPLHQGEYQTGAFAAAATLVALHAREWMGKGQHVDISSLEFHGVVGGSPALTGIISGNLADPVRTGHRRNPFYPFAVLRCKDGYVEIVSPREAHWQRLMKLMGSPQWADDPRFADRRMRVLHSNEIDAHLEAWLMQHTRAELMDLFRDNGLPFQPVHDVEHVVESEHLRERGYFVSVENGARAYRYPGAPFRFSEIEWHVERAAPRFGEHNYEVIVKELGYSREEFAELLAAGVVL